jgi:hypothetical protein
MGTKIEKQIEEVKLRITVLEIIYKLGELHQLFDELYEKTKLDAHLKAMEWIHNKTKELVDLL